MLLYKGYKAEIKNCFKRVRFKKNRWKIDKEIKTRDNQLRVWSMRKIARHRPEFLILTSRSGKDIFFSVFRLKLLPLHPKIWLI